MPTKTFDRLNHKKKSRFLQEAYNEFSINTFQGASITNLVKTLGIAKGSVYQYFDDKEDLYQFLVEEVIRQLNALLDKTCPYDGDEFFSWYNRLLIVQLKYFLSFPSHAVILRNVNSGVVGADRALRDEIFKSQQSRINAALSSRERNNRISMQLLLSAPLQLFDLATAHLNLARIISANDPIYMDADKLMDLCSQWVQKLKSGI